MNRILKMKVVMQIPGKAIKIITWTTCLSLILLLLAGGVIAYGVSYQGLDIPIRLHSNEKIYWPELIKDESTCISLKEISKFKNKIIILKWDLGYLGQAIRIGRGPPSYLLNL
ncbi:MAG: hypothetical protein ACOX47_08015 [Bacillota bacterium]|jgi:hypothetical protein